MKKLTVLMVLAMVLAVAFLAGCSSRNVEVLNPANAIASEEGIALAIVYDNSGSMSDNVLNEKGEQESKQEIAKRAFIKVIESLKGYSENGGKKVQVGVATFGFSSPVVGFPMSDFNYDALIAYAKTLGADQNTPLGVTVELAAGMVLQSPMKEKHIVVLTDGLNNTGPDPVSIMASTEYRNVVSKYPVGTYFVAFDISGDRFSNLIPLGAKIFEATDEKELDLKFTEILVEEILFEDPNQ